MPLHVPSSARSATTGKDVHRIGRESGMPAFVSSKRIVCAIVGIGLVLALAAAWAQKTYGPGVTDTEIKLGQTMSYSGPASSLGAQGQTDGAYFAKINEQGGINGRQAEADQPGRRLQPAQDGGAHAQAHRAGAGSPRSTTASARPPTRRSTATSTRRRSRNSSSSSAPNGSGMQSRRRGQCRSFRR